ncbi:MAG TPA: DUF3365 domain-containing protein [Arcobacter sp.]|nr:DUF3365 domain-containing protein [Arcobacter sp.]
MLLHIIKNKIIWFIVFITALLMVSLAIYLPKVTEQNTIDLVVENSKNSVKQMKLTRAYYVDQIVGDVKKYAPNIKFDYEHDGVDGKIAFPTSVIHDLSDIYSKNTGVKFQLYSNFPFKPKANRVLTPKQKEVLEYIDKHDESMYVNRGVYNGKEVIRVAIADIMDQQACVSCHNTHKDRTWEAGKWKLGDKRGVIEIITPITKSLENNTNMLNKVLGFIAIAMIILVVFYSIFLIRREKELLDENKLLDKKIKGEVEKNLQTEKQLVQQSRSAAMGDMMAAIIHQWKQPLNSISMATSAIELEIQLGLLDDKSLQSKLNNTKEQIEIMDNTMNDFRNFFKPQESSVYNLNECIDTTLTLVGKIYEKDNIEIVTNYGDEIYTKGFINEMNQVVINILNNARDIIVEKDASIKKIEIKTTKKDNNVYMEISDFAGGVPEEIMDTIFDPYVTTKSNEHGTGIGLDMSKVIIEKVGGTISVENRTSLFNETKYIGACFIIELNASNEKKQDLN